MAKGTKPTKAPPYIERVRLIRNAMIERKWGRAMAAQFADEWNLDGSTVRTAAAEAGRWLTEALGDPDALRSMLWGYLEEAVELARLDASPAQGANAIVRATDMMAKLAGLLVQKVALTDTSGADLPAEVHELLKRPQAAAFVASALDPPPKPEPN